MDDHPFAAFTLVIAQHATVVGHAIPSQAPKDQVARQVSLTHGQAARGGPSTLSGWGPTVVDVLVA